MLTASTQMYFARIIFPERMMYDFRITTFEELVFKIMTLEIFDETKKVYKEYAGFDQTGVLYPTVLRVSRVGLLQMYQDRAIVNPKLLWELSLNRYFYDMVNNETCKIMNYSMHHMHQFKYEDFLDYGVFYENSKEMDEICRFKGICNKQHECNSCNFSYKLYREQK